MMQSEKLGLGMAEQHCYCQALSYMGEVTGMLVVYFHCDLLLSCSVSRGGFHDQNSLVDTATIHAYGLPHPLTIV